MTHVSSPHSSVRSVHLPHGGANRGKNRTQRKREKFQNQRLSFGKIRQQKLLPLRPRRIVEESQLRDVQCRLASPSGPPNLELGTEGKGKYEEERKEEKSNPNSGGRRRYL